MHLLLRETINTAQVNAAEDLIKDICSLSMEKSSVGPIYMHSVICAFMYDTGDHFGHTPALDVRALMGTSIVSFMGEHK